MNEQQNDSTNSVAAEGTQAAPTGMAGERSVPSVSDHRDPRRRRNAMIVVVIALACLGTALFFGIRTFQNYVREMKASSDRERPKATSGALFDPLVPKLVEPVKPIPLEPTKPIAVVTTEPSKPAQAALTTQERRARSAFDSDMMVSGGGVVTAPSVPNGPPSLTSLMQALQPRPESDASDRATVAPATNGAYMGTLSSSVNPATAASVVVNPSMMALRGQSVECVLDSRLDSSIAGPVRCTLTENLYSSNGKVVLAERGSFIVGEHAAVTKVGQGLIPVIGARLQTPMGVLINIDSPGTDALGASGVPGYVDNHWPERIGASLLLALVQDAAAYASATKTGADATGTTVNNFQSSQAMGQTLAGKVLDSTINIPPTITRLQGTRMRIVFARDLDFSTVYRLAAR